MKPYFVRLVIINIAEETGVEPHFARKAIVTRRKTRSNPGFTVTLGLSPFQKGVHTDMPMQPLHLSRTAKRLLIGGTLAAGLATLATAADAQEPPSFRKGMWEFNRTVDGGAGKPQTIATKKCASPTDDMRKQNEMLEKAGCKFSPATRSGASYSFTSECNIKGVSAQSKSVITVDGDSAYKVNVESHQGGQSTKELLVAKRIGDC